MRLSKSLGLATIAAVTAMALVGVTSAPAEPTALCEKNEEPCAEENIYMGHFAALAEGPKLLTSKGTITCKKARLLGFALGLGNPMAIHLEVFDFVEDCLTGEEEGCAFQTVQLGLALLLRTASNLGTLTIENTKVLVICPGAMIHCLYGAEPVFDFLGSPNGGALATIHATEVLWEHGEGLFCPEGESKLDALYSVLLPDPIAITT